MKPLIIAVMAGIFAAAPGLAAPAAMASWAAPEACIAVALAKPVPAGAEPLLARFDRTWPDAWQTRGRLAKQPFTTASLRAVVTDLACLSTLAGSDDIVKDARALFASKRHGKAAFDLLDGVARGTGTDPAIRTAARIFHAQMRFEVDDVRLH